MVIAATAPDGAVLDEEPLRVFPLEQADRFGAAWIYLIDEATATLTFTVTLRRRRRTEVGSPGMIDGMRVPHRAMPVDGFGS